MQQRLNYSLAVYHWQGWHTRMQTLTQENPEPYSSPLSCLVGWPFWGGGNTPGSQCRISRDPGTSPVRWTRFYPMLRNDGNTLKRTPAQLSGFQLFFCCYQTLKTLKMHCGHIGRKNDLMLATTNPKCSGICKTNCILIRREKEQWRRFLDIFSNPPLACLQAKMWQVP